jgi:hypothetical protein
LLTKAASAAATAQQHSLINLLSPATHHLWDTLFSVKENMVEYFCALNHICCCYEIQTISLLSLLLQNPENSLSVTKKKIKKSNLICAIAALCVLLVAAMASHFLGLLLWWIRVPQKEGRKDTEKSYRKEVCKQQQVSVSISEIGYVKKKKEKKTHIRFTILCLESCAKDDRHVEVVVVSMLVLPAKRKWRMKRNPIRPFLQQTSFSS